MGQPAAGAVGAGAGWGCWTWTGDSPCSAMMLPERPGTRRPSPNFPSSNTFQPRSASRPPCPRSRPPARRREEAGHRGGGGRGGRRRRPRPLAPRRCGETEPERGAWARRPRALSARRGHSEAVPPTRRRPREKRSGGGAPRERPRSPWCFPSAS